MGTITSAKNTILYAITGVVVSVSGYAVVEFVSKLLGSESTSAIDFRSWPILTGIAILTLLSAAPTVFRRSSRILRRLLQLVVWLAALWLPRAERAAYREQMRAMLLAARRWHRWSYIFDLLTRSAAMGLRRRQAMHPRR
jgi:hypothetical protein